MNCIKHGGPNDKRQKNSKACTICAIENQTAEIINTLLEKTIEESTKNMALTAMLKPNHWHEVKVSTDGKVFIRSIPDSEIYIMPREPWYKRLWSWVFMWGFVPRMGK